MTTFATTPRAMTNTGINTGTNTGTNTGLELDYPMCIGSYDDYGQAQQVVNYLSDHGFAVENMSIVGTDLRSVERVTGRLTRAKVAAAGALSGLWLGMFVGIAFELFSTHGQLAYLITTPLLGALFGVIWSQLGYSVATRSGAREFSSVRGVVAANYQVLVESRLADQARQILATMPTAMIYRPTA